MTSNPTDTNNEELRPCPFCGAGKAMLYKVTGKDVHGFDRPELFCDACKATVYFEDSTSTGADVDRDARVLNEKLIEGWNSRDQQIALAAQIKVVEKLKATEWGYDEAFADYLNELLASLKAAQEKS